MESRLAYFQPLRFQTQLATRSSANHSKTAPCGGILLVCQGKLPAGKLQKRREFSVLLLKRLNTEPQRLHDILSGQTFAKL